MVNHGSLQHQELIKETIKQLENCGYIVVNMKGMAPDAIAVKDNKIYAVEILLIQNKDIPKKGWEHLKQVKDKRESYSMFDDVIFKVAGKDIKILTGQEEKQKQMEKKAKNLVDDFIKELQYNKDVRDKYGL